MSRRPLPPRFSPGWPATPLSLFRRFVCFSGALPCACLPHFSAQSTDRRNGRTEGRIVLLFSCSLSGWNGSFSFSPHIEARFPREHSKGVTPLSLSFDRCRAPEKDIISTPAALNSKWKKNWTLGEFGQRQIIHRPDGRTRVVKSLPPTQE